MSGYMKQTISGCMRSHDWVSIRPARSATQGRQNARFEFAGKDIYNGNHRTIVQLVIHI
jgi:hypothetical protein